jgi:ATP-dependent RNA helicase DDX41
MDSQGPPPKSGVVYGKPMRKFKPILLEDSIADEMVIEKIPEASVEASPRKQTAKTLLEASSEMKRSDIHKDENVGVDKRLLLSALASSKDSERISTCWTPFSYAQSIPETDMAMVRKHLKIIVEGRDIPPLALDFKDLRMPEAIKGYLIRVKQIQKPSLIQMQGISAALAGRDLIGIASTGSGKTLAFCIPLILSALESEVKLELLPGEGPIGIVLAPSRELARQTYQQCCEISEYLAAAGFPALRIVNLIGGLPIGDQIALVKQYHFS